MAWCSITSQDAIWIELSQDFVQWLALVLAEVHLQVQL
jgi:hypothetical protein